jgi:hypothetical protein
MRKKIVKAIRKSAYANVSAEEALKADALKMTNVRLNQEGKLISRTLVRDHNAPRAFYRRMKKMWASLSLTKKLEVRRAVPGARVSAPANVLTDAATAAQALEG